MVSSESRFGILGFVGGVGSGKSTLSRWLDERFDVARIDGDELGHRVLKNPLVRDKLVDRFGSDILGADREIDRAALGKLVWGDSDEISRRRTDLEQIVHPEIRKLTLDRIETAKQNNQSGVLLDAAVMLESGWADICDRIVFIDKPLDLRERHVNESRKWSPEMLRSRERSQWPLEKKKQHCDLVIDNSGTIDQAGEQLVEFVRQEFGWTPE